MLSFKTSYLPRSLHFLHVESEIMIAIALVPLEFLHRNVVCMFEILKKGVNNINLFTKQTGFAFLSFMSKYLHFQCLCRWQH